MLRWHQVRRMHNWILPGLAPLRDWHWLPSMRRSPSPLPKPGPVGALGETPRTSTGPPWNLDRRRGCSACIEACAAAPYHHGLPLPRPHGQLSFALPGSSLAPREMGDCACLGQTRRGKVRTAALVVMSPWDQHARRNRAGGGIRDVICSTK